MSESSNAFADFFRELERQHGINLSVFYDSFDAALFMDGVYHTLFLSVASIICSILIGALGAFLLFLGERRTKLLVNSYVTVFRNTPPLVQLYFFYFALGPYVSNLLNAESPVIGNIGWAVISLTLYAGAFNVEIFRSGIEAVPRTTLEAADALGMNRSQQFLFVAAPLAWRIGLPALNNNLVNLIKTTTNAYAIAVPEVLYAASQVWSEHLNTFEMMCLLLAFYTLIIGIFISLMNRWERATRVPGWGQT